MRELRINTKMKICWEDKALSSSIVSSHCAVCCAVCWVCAVDRRVAFGVFRVVGLFGHVKGLIHTEWQPTTTRQPMMTTTDCVLYICSRESTHFPLWLMCPLDSTSNQIYSKYSSWYAFCSLNFGFTCCSLRFFLFHEKFHMHEFDGKCVCVCETSFICYCNCDLYEVQLSYLGTRFGFFF